MWGKNDYGQIGDNTTTNKLSPIISNFFLNSNKKISFIANGASHVLVITTNEEVYGWGRNDMGQIGNITSEINPNPILIDFFKGKGADKISCGDIHSLVGLKTGEVYAFGSNERGQLGDGSTVTKNYPVLIKSNKNIFQISAGGFHSLAITSIDYEVISWGANDFGQLGDTTFINSNVPVNVDYLKGKYVSKISAGSTHSMCLASNEVYAWGDNRYGQIGDSSYDKKSIPTLVSNFKTITIIEISAGSRNSFAVSKDFYIYSWGSNEKGQLGNSQKPYEGLLLFFFLIKIIIYFKKKKIKF